MHGFVATRPHGYVAAQLRDRTAPWLHDALHTPRGNSPPDGTPRIRWPELAVSHHAGTQARFRWNATMVKS